MFNWLRLCKRHSNAPVAASAAHRRSWFLTAHDPDTDKTSWVELNRLEFDSYTMYIRAKGHVIPTDERNVLPEPTRWSTQPLVLQPDAHILSVVLMKAEVDRSTTVPLDYGADEEELQEVVQV